MAPPAEDWGNPGMLSNRFARTDCYSLLQVVILSQVLACEATLGYEDLFNVQVEMRDSIPEFQSLVYLHTIILKLFMCR